MTEDAKQAAEIARRHPGWIVWASRPTATRAGAKARPRNDGVFAMTVEADSWAELDARLAEQDAHDEELAAVREIPARDGIAKTVEIG